MTGKKPPAGGANTRFQKGQSGNRRGRPKGAQNMQTIVHRVAFERHRVREDGKTRSRPVCELLFLVLQGKALAGDSAAVRLYYKYQDIYSSERPVAASGGCVVVPERLTMDRYMLSLEARKAQQAWEKANGIAEPDTEI